MHKVDIARDYVHGTYVDAFLACFLSCLGYGPSGQQVVSGA